MNESNAIFSASASVESDRILYTPSVFARMNLLYLQETGLLTALRPHTSRREKLLSCLCFAVVSGSGSLVYNDCDYRLKAGDVVFINCKNAYAHSTDPQDLWTLRWCHFYGASVPAVYLKYCERGGGPVIHPPDAGPYLRLLAQLHELAGSDDYIRDMRINEKLSMLLTCLMQESWHPDQRLAERSAKLDVKRIKTYIDENYSSRLTLEGTAETFFVNKHYLARLFKEQYGMTLTAYIQRVRVTHAKQRLRFSDQKIEQIGLECGFGELTYFSRVFKKLEGVSPKEYQKLWRQRE